MDHRGNNVPCNVSVGGHFEKIRQWGVGDVGTDPMTIHRGYDGPSSGSLSVLQ